MYRRNVGWLRNVIVNSVRNGDNRDDGDDDDDDNDDDDDDDDNNNNNNKQTDRTIPNNRPDIVIRDNEAGTYLLTYFMVQSPS